MANDKHYPAGTSGGKGGQFAPKGSQGQVQGQNEGNSSISYVPKTMSNGRPRTYFSDLSNEEQEKYEKNYFDKHKDIFAVNDYYYDNFNTSKINTDQRKFERQQWINDEFNDQMKASPKKQEKKATILLGLPGSGKSTIARPLMNEMGAFIIDADNFKERIPEFQKDHRMVSAVHPESVQLSDSFRNQLSDQGYNMIIGKVGGDIESIDYIMDELANKGYQIDIVVNDLPMELAIQRTQDRYDRGETDRMIPFWTLKNADKNLFKTFDTALQHPAVTGGKIYNNDVPKGTAPILLKEFKK